MLSSWFFFALGEGQGFGSKVGDFGNKFVELGSKSESPTHASLGSLHRISDNVHARCSTWGFLQNSRWNAILLHQDPM